MRCAPESCAKSAGRHFNRGQRAFFFALGYLGWFVSPWLLFADHGRDFRRDVVAGNSPRTPAPP